MGQEWLESVAWALGVVLLMGMAIQFFPGAKKWKKYNLPPGPPTLPIIGNIHQLLNSKKLPNKIVTELAKIYGPVMMMKIGVKTMVFVSSPELATEVLKAKDHIYGNRPLTENLGVKKYLVYGDYHLPTTQLGEYHTFGRKLLVTELLSQKQLQSFQALRMEEQDLFIREIFEACTSTPNKPVQLRDLLRTLTINVVTRMAFSRKFFGIGPTVETSKVYESWKFVMTEVVELFGTTMAEDAFPALKWVDVLTGIRGRMNSVFSLMDSLLQNLVDEHQQHLEGLSPHELKDYEAKDYMDVMLLLSKEEGTKDAITNVRVKAAAADLLIAGSETTGTAFEWVLAELMVHPKILKKATEEVDSVVGKHRCVHELDIPHFRYLDAVVKESFRLHPPFPWLLPRSNRIDTKLAGYDIPAESIINVDIYTMSRDPMLWKDPLKFDPDRFLISDSMNIDFKGVHPQLLPFGSGRRICPGILMSQTLTMSTLARLIHSFDWTLPLGVSPHQLDMSETFSATLPKKEKLEALAKPRLPLHLYNLV